MWFSRPSILLASVLQATQVALAFHIDLPTRSEASRPNLFARDPNTTAGVDFNYTVEAYYINITLGGRPFSIQIDTGSSDFWVAGTVPNANSTGVSAKIQYAVGEDEGPIQTADLTILGYNVSNQAFIEVTPAAKKPDGYGLIGLGPSSGSEVLAALNHSAAGDPPIDRIFRQDTSDPSFITILLSRPNDTQEAYTGEMTISQVLPLFQNISSQPRVSVSVLPSNISSAQHFHVLLDPDGIIGPDGNPIKSTSNASLAPSHDPRQLQVMFDTGFNMPQVPRDVAKAIYSGVKGAQLVNIPQFNGDTWIVDCQAEINISFKIGGQTYPIHPLDVTQALTTPNGTVVFCFGTFQPIIPTAKDDTLDGILGMSFLSNVYILLNYGSFIDGSTSNTSAPYVQLLSTTDPAQAHADFVATRSDPKYPKGPVGSGSSNKNSLFQMYIIAAATVALCML